MGLVALHSSKSYYEQSVCWCEKEIHMTRAKFPFWMNSFDDWTNTDGGAAIMTIRYNIQDGVGEGQWEYWEETVYGTEWWNQYDKTELLKKNLLVFLRENKWEQ